MQQVSPPALLPAPDYDDITYPFSDPGGPVPRPGPGQVLWPVTRGQGGGAGD
jgi:hypothetical protein